MEGVVDVVIRDLLSQIGGMDRMVTEFVRVTDKLLPDHVFYRYCPELKASGQTPAGVPVFIQLLGGQPTPLGENAHKAVELGAPGIDLNFGCPAKTVNRHDGGATLLKNPERLYAIISEVKKSVRDKVPVTAKVRLGFSDKSLVKEIAEAADAAGAHYLVVHARTKLEGYAPPAHWEFIRTMKESVNIPVIANGDIWAPEDYLRCCEISGCKDIALGRGLMSRPSLASEIKALVDEQSHKRLSWNEIVAVWLPRFIAKTLEYRGENYTLPRTKQFLKFLSREYPEAQGLFDKIKVCKSLKELEGVFHADTPHSSLRLDVLPLLSQRDFIAEKQVRSV